MTRFPCDAARASQRLGVSLTSYFVIARDASLPTSSLVRMRNEFGTRVKFPVFESTV